MDPFEVKHMAMYQNLLQWVTAYKGLMHGIGAGFYEDPKYLCSDKCLDEEAMEALYNMLEGFNHGAGAMETSAKFFAAAMTFAQSTMDNCNSHQFIYDIITFTFMTGFDKWALIANFCMKIDIVLFTGAGIFQAIILKLIQWGNVINLLELYDGWRNIGQNLGTITIAVTGFRPDKNLILED